MVSVVGDGSFCFSGPQPLWTMARYKAPVMNVVLNNHSYNNERNRIWHYGGRQFKTGRDMTCYLGSPDVDYAKASEAFGVEGEVVKEPGKLKAAIGRAKRAIADGRPYLLDVHTYRDGSARPRPGIRPIRSRTCARGRCDHDAPPHAVGALRPSCCSAATPLYGPDPRPPCRQATAATSSPPPARNATP